MKFVTDSITRERALLSVGKGWAELINEAYDYLDQHHTAKVILVKEKYGGLRIYIDIYEDQLHNFIMKLEKRSFSICETCGNPGQLRGSHPGTLYLTRCEEHSNGTKAIKPF